MLTGIIIYAVSIIWAYGAVDDLLSDHVEAGSGTVVVNG